MTLINGRKEMRYEKQVGLMFGIFGVAVLVSASFQNEIETAIDYAVAGSGLLATALYYVIRKV
jgi:hypothetical protein